MFDVQFLFFKNESNAIVTQWCGMFFWMLLRFQKYVSHVDIDAG
eukprot:UN20378